MSNAIDATLPALFGAYALSLAGGIYFGTLVFRAALADLAKREFVNRLFVVFPFCVSVVAVYFTAPQETRDAFGSWFAAAVWIGGLASFWHVLVAKLLLGDKLHRSMTAKLSRVLGSKR